MFTKASDRIVANLIIKQIVNNEDKEIYSFGINRVLTIFLNVVTTLVLGLIYGQIFGVMLFFIAFILLRSYSGGYHASTPIKCYVLTVLLITAILSVMNFVYLHRYVCFGLSLLSGIIIIILSPSEAKNKPLDEIERIIYKRKTVSFLCIEVIIIIVSIGLNYIVISYALMLAIVTTAISLIVSNVRCSI